MKEVAIIGAGAAGLMCAVQAARNGNRVTVFEKNEKAGKKIYITGKGRCNFTNDCPPEEFLQNVVHNGKFLHSGIYSFTPQDTIEFFEACKMPTKVERGNRAFPASDKASDVTKALEEACKKEGVIIRYGVEIQDISITHSTMHSTENSTMCGDVYSTVCGIIVKNRLIPFDCVVVCTGGLSYPSTGSTGDGYRFAESAGHTIVKPVPALVGIDLKGTFYREMQGLSLKNVTLSVEDRGRVIASQFGEMMFTHFGISGPIVLSLSSVINRLDLKNLRLVLDLKPALSEEQLDRRLLRDFEANSAKTLYNCLRALLPVALIAEVLKRSGIPSDKKVSTVSKEERARLLTTVKNFDMLIASLRDFSEAIVTAGGVDVKEINPKTMESKLCHGLYFCGEVLDVDAYTGGFNLQIAFSTAYAAGSNMG